MIKDEYLRLLGSFNDSESDFFLKVDTKNKAPIFIGITKTRKPFFMFEISVNNIVLAQQLKETGGYSISIADPREDNKGIRIRLEAITDGWFDIFFNVVDDLITIVKEQKNADTSVIIARLLLWEDFFSHTNSGVLSEKKEIGLFGELLFVEEELSNGNWGIINSWVGPLKGVKDFVIGETAVEVKTTIVTATNRLKISDENQLDDSGFTRLFLNYRLLTQNQMDGRSLPELFDDIIEKVEHNPCLMNAFLEKAMHAGYKDVFREKYSRKYEQGDVYWFMVRDYDDQHFPRILPSDLKIGIKFVKYQIELSTLEPFSVERPSLS